MYIHQCMKVNSPFAPVFLLIGLTIVAACQNKRTVVETTADQATPPVAVLSKPAFILGDSILVQLSEPLNQVTVRMG